MPEPVPLPVPLTLTLTLTLTWAGAVSAFFEGVGTTLIELSKIRQVAKWKQGQG